MSSSLRAVAARLCLLPLLLAPSAVTAQDPPLPDSLAVVGPDTIQSDSVEARPLVTFPAMHTAAPAGYAAGEWVWDREALLREAPVSLADLLEHIPGITALRADVYVHPQAAAAFGGTAGRVEIEIDGYVLDPLAASSFDLAHIPLAQLQEVRVQRRLGLLRIRLTTEQAVENQPYSRIEAGIGEPIGNVFRGLFLAPHVIVGPLGLAVERVDSDGFRRGQPGDVFMGWAKWAWTTDARGVQLEFLQSRLRREPQTPWLTDRTRRDIVVRARNAFSDMLTGEVYAGRSAIDETVPGVTDAEDIHYDRASLQAGARAAAETELGVVTGALRYRSGDLLPSLEAVLTADIGAGPVRAGAEFVRSDWPDAEAANHASVHAEISPLAPGALLGVSAFAEATRGSRGVPLYGHGAGDEDAGDNGGAAEQPVLSGREGWRVGASVQIAQRAFGSAAFVTLDADETRPFGLPFDSAGVPTPVSGVRGIEAHGRLVLLPDLMTIDSWITNWSDVTGWAYLPARTWRTALQVHTLPLPSGNLEVLARLEASHRSGMLAYAGDGDAGTGLLAMPGHTVAHGYLQIRVIDVRIFLRWEDLLTTQPESLPGRVLTGPRILYGVKWTLRN